MVGNTMVQSRRPRFMGEQQFCETLKFTSQNDNTNRINVHHTRTFDLKPSFWRYKWCKPWWKWSQVLVPTINDEHRDDAHAHQTQTHSSSHCFRTQRTFSSNNKLELRSTAGTIPDILTCTILNLYFKYQPRLRVSTTTWFETTVLHDKMMGNTMVAMPGIFRRNIIFREAWEFAYHKNSKEHIWSMFITHDIFICHHNSGGENYGNHHGNDPGGWYPGKTRNFVKHESSHATHLSRKLWSMFITHDILIESIILEERMMGNTMVAIPEADIHVETSIL